MPAESVVSEQVDDLRRAKSFLVVCQDSTQLSVIQGSDQGLVRVGILKADSPDKLQLEPSVSSDLCLFKIKLTSTYCCRSAASIK